MSLKSLLMPALSRYFLSAARLARQRAAFERRRAARGEPHRVLLFLQPDDPYSALLAQALPRFLARYDVTLETHVVSPPADDVAPARAELIAYGRRDAALLAARHGLDFTDAGSQPPAAALAAATARLVALAGTDAFAPQAAKILTALWHGEALPAGASADSATVAAHVGAADALRARLGHYLGAMLYYGGEWYWGIDRLYHLEERLQALGAARPGTGGLLFAPCADAPEAFACAPGATLDFFVSLRSPYSAIVTPRVFALARRCGAQLRLRYVLPMVMRGLPVPAAKRRYISLDTAREARWRGIPFGCVNDPVGRPTERGLAVLHMAVQRGRGEEFLQSFMQGVWAEGVDAGSDAGLRRLAERAGLGWSEVQAALRDDGWRAVASANRDEMFGLGLWGVPTLRTGGVSVWGQDRLWAIETALREGNR